MPERYDLSAAAHYWGKDRLKARDDLAAVLSMSEPAEVNEAYHRWESSLVVHSLGKLSGRRIADIACGLGRLTVPLAKAGAQVLALDNAPGMLKRCEAAVVAARVRSRVQLAQGPAWQIPVPDGSLDGAVCVGLLEHLPPGEQTRVLTEIARAVRKGGRLVTVFNNPHSILLRSPSDNRFRKGHQFPNGYFCALVDRKRLLKQLGKKFKVEMTGSNLFYSVLRHIFRGLKVEAADTALRRKTFALSADLDLRFRLKGPLDDLLTDHTFFVATRR